MNHNNIKVNMKSFTYNAVNILRESGIFNEVTLIKRIGRIDQKNTNSFSLRVRFKKFQTDGINKNIVSELVTVHFIVNLNSYPGQISKAFQCLPGHLVRDNKTILMLATPVVLEKTKEICRQHGIGWLDSAGNIYLRYKAYRILINRNGNNQLENKLINPIFAKKAVRGLRLMIENNGKRWTLIEIAEKAQISIGEAFNLKNNLCDFGWITEDQRKFVIKDPERNIPDILRMWNNHCSMKKTRPKHFYARYENIDMLEADISKICLENGFPYALTGISGLRRRFPEFNLKPETPVSLYLAEPDHLKHLADKLNWKEFKKPMSVDVVFPFEQSVLWGTRTIGDVAVVSDVQLYLDVANNPDIGSVLIKSFLETIIKEKDK